MLVLQMLRKRKQSECDKTDFCNEVDLMGHFLI